MTPWTAARQASLSVTNSRSLLKLMSIRSVMSSNHLVLCHPLLLLPIAFPSMRIFSNESLLPIRWPEDWRFSFSIRPSNEYSFRIDWFDVLAFQGTPKSLLQQMQGTWVQFMCHGILQARILKWVAIPISGDLPDLGVEPMSPALQADSLLSEPPGKPLFI